MHHLYQSITNCVQSAYPYSQRSLLTTKVSRFLDPIFFGDYPEVMKTRLDSRLPVFSESESLDIKGSADFVGINHYTSFYVTDRPPGSPAPSYFEQYAKDPEVIPQSKSSISLYPSHTNYQNLYH